MLSLQRCWAADGSLTVKIEGRLLHSAFHPWREAERILPLRRAACYLIMGEGLGYLSQLLRRRQPDCRLLLLCCDAGVVELADFPAASLLWHPGCGIELAAFLRCGLRGVDFPDLEVLSWPASQCLFPQVFQTIERAVLAIMQQLQSEYVTVSAWGRVWLRNTLDNWCALQAEAPIGWGKEATVVVAAGPSLNGQLPLLSRYRKHLRVLACTSALATLHAAGIRADAAISSDPGWLARRHYFHLTDGLPLLVPLTAQPWRAFVPGPVRPFLQGNLWEEVLPSWLADLLPRIEETGTVVGSALLLARQWGADPLIVVGLDLAYYQLEQHSRPHAFDPLLLGGQRFLPLQQQRWLPLLQAQPCGQGWWQSASLREYQRWLERWAQESSLPLFQLGPRQLAGWQDAAQLLPQLPVLPPWQAPHRRLALPPPLQRRRLLREILARWSRDWAERLQPEGAELELSVGAQREHLLALAPLPYRDFLRQGGCAASRAELQVALQFQLSLLQKRLND